MKVSRALAGTLAPTLATMVLGVLATIVAPTETFGDIVLEGGEFQINTYTTNQQRTDIARAVASGPDGSFVVVWETFGPDEVRGQRFDNTGARIGTEFQINTYTTRSQDSAAIAAAADGSFVVVWESNGQGEAPGSFNIEGQRFSSTAVPVGTEFQVNDVAALSQFGPHVAVAADGRFVVAWTSFGGDSNNYGVRARRFLATGAPAAPEFQVNTFALGRQSDPLAAMASDGSFVIVWSSNPTGEDGTVQGQRYDALGAPLGTEFQIDGSPGNREATALAMAPDDSFVVGWTRVGPVFLTDSIHGRRVDSTGAFLGTEFPISSHSASSQVAPAISVAADGSFVAVWQGYGAVGGSGGDIRGRRFDSTGTATGAEFFVNSSRPNGQYAASITTGVNDDFVVAWASREQDGWFSGVFGQRLSYEVPGPCAVPTPECGNGVREADEECDVGSKHCNSDCTCPMSTGDADSDGVDDYCDNCPNENPDQRNSDCPGGGCGDDGDTCDVCPAKTPNFNINGDKNCDADLWGGKSVGPAGDTLLFPPAGATLATHPPNARIEIEVPAGALVQDTSISLTGLSDEMTDPIDKLIITQRFKMELEPKGVQFCKPLKITVHWADADTDDRIDEGICQPSGTVTCDQLADCLPGTCSQVGQGQEADLKLKLDGQFFNHDGFVGGNCSNNENCKCEDNLAVSSACGTATALCEGTASQATVAKCCDMDANKWLFETCHFSTLITALAVPIPGGGSAGSDCVAEWIVRNPTNTPEVDKTGFTSGTQTCTDGDPLCDADGAADGRCTFAVSMCFKNEDARLSCASSDVASWEIRKPRPDSTKAIEAANALALRTAVEALGPSTVGGSHQSEVTFAPPLVDGDLCTELVDVEVPLGGANADKKGKAALKTRATTAAPDPSSRGMKDSDGLKLYCLPAP